MFSKLTPREQQVALGLIEGKTYKMIGIDLGIMEATVKVHAQAAFRACKVHNQVQLAITIDRELRPHG